MCQVDVYLTEQVFDLKKVIEICEQLRDQTDKIRKNYW